MFCHWFIDFPRHLVVSLWVKVIIPICVEWALLFPDLCLHKPNIIIDRHRRSLLTVFKLSWNNVLKLQCYYGLLIINGLSLSSCSDISNDGSSTGFFFCHISHFLTLIISGKWINLSLLFFSSHKILLEIARRMNTSTWILSYRINGWWWWVRNTVRMYLHKVVCSISALYVGQHDIPHSAVVLPSPKSCAQPLHITPWSKRQPNMPIMSG